MIYFYYLEIALADPSDTHVYAFENISHVPAAKLIEIFEIDLQTDPQIARGYLLTKAAYAMHKEYIDKNIGPLDLNKFEYTLRLYADDGPASVRRLYKEHFLE